MSAPRRYSHLVAYWQCPRRWAYVASGYEPIRKPDALLRGQFAHAGVAGHWRGETVKDAVAKSVMHELTAVRLLNEREVESKLAILADEATALAEHFVNRHGSEFVAGQVEKPIVLGLLQGTPDAVGLWREKWPALFELKTSANPDLRTLAMSGQADYYAWLWKQTTSQTLELCIWAIVTPELVSIYERKPRLDRGEYMAERLALMQDDVQAAYAQPQFGYWCRQCPYQEACLAREMGADDTAVLASTCFIRDGERERVAEVVSG